MSPIAARKKTIIWMIAAIVLAVSSIASIAPCMHL